MSVCLFEDKRIKKDRDEKEIKIIEDLEDETGYRLCSTKLCYAKAIRCKRCMEHGEDNSRYMCDKCFHEYRKYNVMYEEPQGFPTKKELDRLEKLNIRLLNFQNMISMIRR